MCGETVNVVHLFLIGPVILLSTYYQWTLPLYILGGGVMVIHGLKFIERWPSWKASGSSVGAGYSAASHSAGTIGLLQKPGGSACSGGCGGSR